LNRTCHWAPFLEGPKCADDRSIANLGKVRLLRNEERLHKVLELTPTEPADRGRWEGHREGSRQNAGALFQDLGCLLQFFLLAVDPSSDNKVELEHLLLFLCLRRSHHPDVDEWDPRPVEPVEEALHPLLLQSYPQSRSVVKFRVVLPVAQPDPHEGHDALPRPVRKGDELGV